MIKINWIGRDRTFETIEEMVTKLKIEPLSEDEVKYVNKKSRKIETIYADVNPLSSDLNGVREIIMCDDAESLSTLRYKLIEEI